MKTQITLFLGLLLSSFFMSAQTVMKIHQSNGRVSQIPLSDIDSITYESGFTVITNSGIQYGNGVTDIDGNSYQTVIIGNQEWMAENLKTSKYNDGSLIPNVKDSSEWENLSSGAWCHYNNDTQYENSYGKLYNWYSVITGNLCPTGWHVSTELDWALLFIHLNTNGYYGQEGLILKSTTNWNNYNEQSGNGLDTYGFKGLPAGQRTMGYFHLVGDEGVWWTSWNDPDDKSYGRARNFSNEYIDYGDYHDFKTSGLSVRCLKN